MGMWPHVQLSLDLVKGCGNSAKNGAIPRKNWPNGPGYTETTWVGLSVANEMWPLKTSSNWRRRCQLSLVIYL